MEPQTGDLHGDGGCAGVDSAGGDELQDGAGYGDRVYSGVKVVVAVFLGTGGADYDGGDCVEGLVDAVFVVGGEAGPEEGSVAVGYF